MNCVNSWRKQWIERSLKATFYPSFFRMNVNASNNAER